MRAIQCLPMVFNQRTVYKSTKNALIQMVLVS